MWYQGSGVKMAYCTNAELTNLTGTELSTTIQDAIIAEADRQIDARLALYGVSGSGNVCKSASLQLSMAGVLRRHQMDGTQPDSLNLGGISLSLNVDAAIRSCEEKAYSLIDDYAKNAMKNRAWMNMVRKVNR